MNIGGYIYLIQEHEHLIANKPIYKIGKTVDTNSKRIQSYAKDSRLLIMIGCINCHDTEKELIRIFHEKYISKTAETGRREDFEGNCMDMIKDIYDKCTTINFANTDDSNVSSESDDSDDVETSKFIIKKTIDLDVYDRHPQREYTLINGINHFDDKFRYNFIKLLIKKKVIKLNHEYDINDKNLIKRVMDQKKRIEIKNLNYSKYIPYKTRICVNTLIRLLFANEFIINGQGILNLNSDPHAVSNDISTDIIMDSLHASEYPLYASENYSDAFDKIRKHLYIDYSGKYGIEHDNIDIVDFGGIWYLTDYLRRSLSYLIEYDVKTGDYYRMNRDYEYIGCNTKSSPFPDSVKTERIYICKSHIPYHSHAAYLAYYDNYHSLIKKLRNSLNGHEIQIDFS